MRIFRLLPSNNSSFWIGFGGSFVIHALLLSWVFWNGDDLRDRIRASAKGQMSTPSLLANFTPPSQAKKSVEPKKLKPEKPKPKPKVQKKQPPAPKAESAEILPKEEPQEIAPEGESENKNSSIDSSSQLSQGASNNEMLVTFDSDGEFLRKIYVAIMKYKKYPRQARRMKIEGKVFVEVGLTEEGKISWMNVIQSSMHEILDQNALEVIKKASTDFPPPNRRVKIQIPIAYLLSDELHS